MGAKVTFDLLVSGRSSSSVKQHQFLHVKVSHHMCAKSAVTQSPAPPWQSVRVSGRGRSLVQWSERLAGWVSLWQLALDWSEDPSVAVGADGWRAFPFPLWSFGLRVLLLLKHRTQRQTRSHGASWLATAQVTWPRGVRVSRPDVPASSDHMYSRGAERASASDGECVTGKFWC